MKLGYNIGTWTKDATTHWGKTPQEAALFVREAEQLGCTTVWVPESYGGEAFTFLSWIGAQTKSIRLGTHVVPIFARTPVNTAQAAATLDRLSGGRVILGIGVSGVAVAEGWYGVPFTKPLARTREYMSVMRKVLAHERPDNPGGEFYPIPAPDGISGIDKALRSTVRPLRADLPIIIGAMGPKNLALAAEISDGWATAFIDPDRSQHFREALDEGFARPGARRSWADFEICANVMVSVGDDVEKAAEGVRTWLALYIGAMGTSERNFQYEMFVRMGYEDVARKVAALYQDGKSREAIAAVPISMVEAVALVGPKAKIRDELSRWKSSFVTELGVLGDFDALRAVAEAM